MEDVALPVTQVQRGCCLASVHRVCPKGVFLSTFDSCSVHDQGDQRQMNQKPSLVQTAEPSQINVGHDCKCRLLISGLFLEARTAPISYYWPTICVSVLSTTYVQSATILQVICIFGCPGASIFKNHTKLFVQGIPGNDILMICHSALSIQIYHNVQLRRKSVVMVRALKKNWQGR